MRTRRLADAWAKLAAAAHQGVFSPGRPAWFEHYWPLLDEVSAHAAIVEAEMLKATFYGDRAHGVALKFSLVVALASKAELHWLVHRDHPESMQRSLDVVMEVVGITRSFKDNDFILLDPLLGVCTASSLGTTSWREADIGVLRVTAVLVYDREDSGPCREETLSSCWHILECSTRDDRHEREETGL